MSLTAAAKEFQKGNVGIQNILVEKAQDFPDICVLLEKFGTTMKVGEGLADLAKGLHDFVKCVCQAAGELRCR